MKTTDRKNIVGLTHPPSSYRWRSPLHRVVCYLESPRDKKVDTTVKTMAIQTDWPLTFLFSLLFTSHVIHFVLIVFAFSSHLPSCSFTSLHPHPLPFLLLPFSTHPTEFVLALGAGVHESLGNDGERGVHYLRHVDVKGEVGILEDVHPEAQRKAARGEGQESSPSLRLLSLLLLQNGGKSHQPHYIYDSGRHFMCESTCLRCN